jgi:hypothetical protein
MRAAHRPNFLTDHPKVLLLAGTTGLLIVGALLPASAQQSSTSCAQDEFSETTAQTCWQGTVDGHGQGNIYNDNTHIDFAFREGKDGTLSGKAHARMSHGPQAHPSECIITRTQDPEEFDVELSGRRNSDQFELTFSPPTTKRTVSGKCSYGSSNTVTSSQKGFLGAIDAVLRPAMVPAKSGRSDLHRSLGGGMEVNAVVELECKRWVNKTDRLALLGPFPPETVGELSPNCGRCPVSWELLHTNLHWRQETKNEQQFYSNTLAATWCIMMLIGSGVGIPLAPFCPGAKSDIKIEDSCLYTFESTWRCPANGKTVQTTKTQSDPGACIPRG